MASETDDHIPLSGLQHVVFCERQAALIHVERVWLENTATTLGRIVHERADTPGKDHRRGVRIARAVSLRSDRLRVVGQADTVEYHAAPTSALAEIPFPVEYKRGRARHQLADQVQLCAQAMCLEEMHRVTVEKGALFYDASHRRVAVEFTPELRARTEAAARRLHELVRRGEVPVATFAPKCRSCSLEPLCMPQVSASPQRAADYLARLFAQASER